MLCEFTTTEVLGSSLLHGTIEQLAAAFTANETCSQEPLAVEFANTHVLSARRTEPEFALASQAFDLTLPDAAPLTWVMAWRSRRKAPRIYGPHFMARMLSFEGATLRHFLVGGQPEYLEILRASYPATNICGGWHGRLDADGGGVDAGNLAAEIAESGADIIWVGLGTPKQQKFIARIKPYLKRGVLMSVGQAFDILAGKREDAPSWMFNNGLTWLYRLCREPRRLAGRYLKYNTLFLWLLALEEVRRCWQHCRSALHKPAAGA